MCVVCVSIGQAPQGGVGVGSRAGARRKEAWRERRAGSGGAGRGRNAVVRQRALMAPEYSRTDASSPDSPPRCVACGNRLLKNSYALERERYNKFPDACKAMIQSLGCHSICTRCTAPAGAALVVLHVR